MARTKQTARQSSGGKAPRQQLASRSSHEMRNFLVSQQASGISSKEKKIFVNYENTFGSFRFQRPKTTQRFGAAASFGRIKSDGNPSLYMRLDFVSNLDGTLTKAERSPLDIVFVVDVSGSMSCSLEDDSDRRSKLDIAKHCMRKIAEELKPCDRVGLVSFNTAPTNIVDLLAATPANLTRLTNGIASLYASGGTELARGLQGGYSQLLQNSGGCGDFRIKRVIFLTDMESSSYDEDEVIALATSHATVPVQQQREEMLNSREVIQSRKRPAPANVTPPIHLTLVGVGVDLSVRAVERISAIRGARYVSVVNATEFFATVVADFNYDVTPIPFDIKVELPSGWAFERIYGSAELNSVKPGAKHATVSSEFPVFLDNQGCTHGGLYLCKLRRNNKVAVPAECALLVSWTDPQGTRHSTSTPVSIPGNASSLEDVDRGLRKAVALADYVTCLTAFGTDQEEVVDAACTEEVGTELVQLGVSQILTAAAAGTLPEGTSLALRKHAETASRFQRLKTHLLVEMAAADDNTLHSSNANVLQTVDQVIDFETAEVTKALREMSTRYGLTVTEEDHAPRGFLCPITLAVMADPVMASDGQSYDRVAITTWFNSGRDTSPVTNLLLRDRTLLPNHALRNAIEEYLAAPPTGPARVVKGRRKSLRLTEKQQST